MLITRNTIFIIPGIHPHDSKSIIEEPKSWFEFETIAQSLECVAIGPCGLDYQRDFSEPDVQKEIFEKQICLAAKLNKPLLIHERSAQADVLDILERFVCLAASCLIWLECFANRIPFQISDCTADCDQKFYGHH